VSQSGVVQVERVDLLPDDPDDELEDVRAELIERRNVQRARLRCRGPRQLQVLEREREVDRVDVARRDTQADRSPTEERLTRRRGTGVEQRVDGHDDPSAWLAQQRPCGQRTA